MGGAWNGGWVELRLTRDCVFVAVTLTDANQEGTVFVLGGQEQLLGLLPVDVAIVPPAEREREVT